MTQLLSVSAPTRMDRLAHAVSSSGVWNTCRDLAQLFGLQPQRDWGADRRFDATHGTDTSGSVEVEALGFSDSDANAQAIRYLPSPDYLTRWLLNTVDVDPRQTAFVDVGCGKGRVIAVASEFPFQRIIGIDLSFDLVATAVRNAGVLALRFPARTAIEAKVADAATFAYPDQSLLLHLYHPFRAAVLARVLDNLQSSVRHRPRRVVVAYLLYTAAIDDVLATFASHPWLPLARREGSVLGQHDWLIFDTNRCAQINRR
jgi:SAM-dependent methyltransferase